MKKILLPLFLIACLSGFSQSQYEMNAEAHASYKKADTELNNIYKQILKQYSADTAFTKSLKAAQRLWIQFRDAELKMKYPDTTPGAYGSVHPMCVSIYLEQLTRERLTTLKEWAKGTEEGDVCSGSQKTKP